MSSDLTPRATGTAPVRADGDNRYKAVQAKLRKLGGALDDASVELESVWRSMRGNGDTTTDTARDVENAGLDPKFVDLTYLVATALGGAAVEIKRLNDSAVETADLARRAQRTHARLYGALDTIRSGRRERTPKPGFFDR